ELGEARSLLESADIECRPAELSFTSTYAPGRRNVYLIDHERLAELGNPEAIEKALRAIDATGGTAIVLSDPGDFDAAWLATSPFVGAWMVRPLDPVGLLGAVRTAERALEFRRRAHE